MRPAVWQRWGAADGKVLPGVKAKSIFASGTGTKDDPFVIETEAQLRAFAASTIGDNAVDYAGQYVALDADITLNGAWTPIHYFAGSFDGRGHTVSGVRIGTELAPLEQSSVGFFDVLSNGASLANLHPDQRCRVRPSSPGTGIVRLSAVWSAARSAWARMHASITAPSPAGLSVRRAGSGHMAAA